MSYPKPIGPSPEVKQIMDRMVVDLEKQPVHSCIELENGCRCPDCQEILAGTQ